MNINIEPIWKEYHRQLHGFIRRRVDDPALADDILQDVFLRVHANLDTLKDRNKLLGWFYRITRNAIIDYYRGRKQTETLPDTVADTGPRPSEEVQREVMGCLLPMIRHLPPQYREAVYLSEIKGLTQKQVAEKQGISLSGAKSRIQRGRAMLKGLLMEGCQFEFDQRGTIIDYRAKGEACKKCGTDTTE